MWYISEPLPTKGKDGKWNNNEITKGFLAAATEVKSINHLKKKEKQKVDNLVVSVGFMNQVTLEIFTDEQHKFECVCAQDKLKIDREKQLAREKKETSVSHV